MFVAYIIVAVVLASLFTVSAAGKLRREKKQIETLDRVGVPAKMVPLLAACEIAGAVGLLVGLAFGPIGIAAAVGTILYFVGAIIGHLRIGDLKGIGPSTFLLVLGVGALVLRIASL